MSEEITQCPVINKSIFRPEVVNKKMAELIAGFRLPSWILFDLKHNERQCPSCSSKLSDISVRGLSLCLNAQHIGDIQVEFLCRECYANFFLHFRRVCGNINDFLNAIEGVVLISPEEPVLRDQIPPSENNVGDILIADDIQEREKSKWQ